MILRVSLQALRGITSWRFRFCEVILSERRITTLIWVSQSDTRFTIVTLVAVVVEPSDSFLTRVDVATIFEGSMTPYRLEVIRCTSRG